MWMHCIALHTQLGELVHIQCRRSLASLWQAVFSCILNWAAAAAAVAADIKSVITRNTSNDTLPWNDSRLSSVVKLIKCNYWQRAENRTERRWDRDRELKRDETRRDESKREKKKKHTSPAECLNVYFYQFRSSRIHCATFVIAKWCLCHCCSKLPFICLDAFEFSSG